MGLEKKLGLGFVGMLFLAFCGVLTMRLTDTTPEEKVEINIGVGAKPQDPALAQTPANTGNAPFANNRGAAPAQPAESYATTNRPTQPNMQTSAPQQAPSYGGGSRYGTPSSSQATLPPPNFATAAPAAAPNISQPSSGAAGASATNLASPNIAPPTVTGVPAISDVERSLANSRYFPPSSASLPTVAPAATSPPGVAAGNPLRETSPSVPPAAAMPTNDRYASPNISAALPMASAAPPAAPYGASPYGTSTAAAREPRPLDTGTARAQPLAAAPPTAVAASNFAASSTASPTLTPPRSSPGVAALAPPGSDARMPAAPMTAAPIATAPTNFGNVAPASAVAPVVSGRDQPYVVAPGDNLFEISRKVYGDGSYYRALFAYNSDRYRHAEDIRSGNVLDVPPAEYLKQRYPELIGGASDGSAGTAPLGRTMAAAGSSYTVREGDTLFDIARKQLGQASRWTELYELNRAALGEHLENLRPGVTLRLP